MTLQQQQEELAAELRAARESRAWYKFLESHREVFPCQANLEMARRYFNGDELSLEDLDLAYTNPAFRNSLALRTESDERFDICKQILALIGGSESAKKAVSDKFRLKSTEELRNDLAQLQEKKKLAGLSKDELKAAATPARPGRQQLPDTVTKAWITHMATPAELKDVIHRFGIDAVNEVLRNG